MGSPWLREREGRLSPEGVLRNDSIGLEKKNSLLLKRKRGTGNLVRTVELKKRRDHYAFKKGARREYDLSRSEGENPALFHAGVVRPSLKRRANGVRKEWREEGRKPSQKVS